ncbi:YobI family P-loop NTPase [Streptococcus anginosus]|uniref:YobI family P-loop NTPase n=1 Tax=Streptococcus anginosus TaxID=1328 RepID=UPI0029C4A7EE|nr:hypothetical protein [Streptococcus anginosus]MDX5015971.1 hypothetical protein [Streptococcus anginosus]MDX5020069.1 hypothetical protein [Streptococcus anginosus]
MIDENMEKGKKYKFRSLTSNKNIEIQPVTLQALEYVISDESEPTNVAITGNYGAGKSSVIESFEKRLQNNSSPKIGIKGVIEFFKKFLHDCQSEKKGIRRLIEFLKKTKNKKFIHISLAQYDETIKNEEKGLNNRQINTIEGKIINQLLHQIEPNSIRKSIFKTLDAESRIHPWRNTAYLFSFLLLFLYFFNFNTWVNLIKGVSWLSWTTNVTSRLVALAILFVLLLYGIFYLLKLQRDIGFIKHLSLKSDKIETDIEVFSNENSKVSYFDRYLDDVIYLFKQSKADVIVFEDIERFNDSRIFEKIKELNIVINRKREVCGESKLVFFYLVKDDLFESQERTKFFDFIIPIVPVVTASNSYDQLSEILKGMELYEELDEKFLFNISLYLDDMRLINNICNEYLTYKESLSTLKLDPEKVFSMIVYKNIFPKDFSLLQKNQGYLYELLHSKDEQLEERKNELSKKIQLLEEDIENAQTEHLRDEVELYGINFQIPEGKAVIKVNGKTQAEFSSYHEFIIELLKEDSKIISFENFYDAYQNQYRFEENLDSVCPNRNSSEFLERLKNIKNKQELSSLKEKLKSLQNAFYKLDEFRLSDIYESTDQVEDIDSKYSQSMKENPQFNIISFIIRNGYIDETYQDYLTYFYGNTITKEEKEFIVNVISGRDGNYDISLTNINEIVNRLELKEYKYGYVLNYSLFEYLLKFEEENDSDERLNLIFHQENILDFLINFYNTLDRTTLSQGRIYQEEAIKLFLEKWLYYNNYVFNKYVEINTGRYVSPNKNNLILSLMNLVDLSDIPEKTKVLIAEYISDNQQLLFASQNYKISQFTQNLSNIDIKFKEYIYRDDIYDKRILDYTYQNNLYLISKANIRFFVDFYSKKDVSEDEFVHKNFELLNTNIKLKPLLDYCLSSEEKLVQYVNLYIKLSSGKMDDHPSYIERLLNHDILFQNRDAENEVITLAEAIFNSIPKFSIDYTVDKFKELSDENKLELINYLVLKQTAKVNSEVVLIYFNNAELIDNYLIDFINHDPSFKLKKNIFLQLDKNLQDVFSTQIISANNLELSIYKSMLKVINTYYEDFDISGLPDDRLEVLIDLKIIKFNATNLEFIRNEYPSMNYYFISRNIKKYIEIEEDVHDETELNDLLKYSELDDSYKLQIIDLLDYVCLKDQKFSIELITHILDSKFDINDFSYIISSDYYDNADESIKNKIRELAKEHWDKLINLDSSEISISLCEWLLGLDDIDDSERKSLLKDNLLSNPEMSKYRLSLLGNNLDLFELWEIMDTLSDSDIYAEWVVTFDKLNQNEDRGHNGNQSVVVPNSEFNIKLLDYLKEKELVSKKSRSHSRGMTLYGFRSGQIEYE